MAAAQEARHSAPWLIVLLFGLIASCASRGVAVVEDIEYLDGYKLDIHYPESGDSHPVLVLLHGAGLTRYAYRPFAQRAAGRGAVVFNVEWDVVPRLWADALEQAGCAVRYAKGHAEEYGGDPQRVVLVGHSSGAVFAGRVATDGEALDLHCPGGDSAVPRALALVAPSQAPGGPGPWPRTTLTGDPNLRVGVIHGQGDAVIPPRVSEATARILHQQGYDVELYLIPGGHYDILGIDPFTSPPGDRSESTEVNPDEAIDLIIGLAQ